MDLHHIGSHWLGWLVRQGENRPSLLQAALMTLPYWFAWHLLLLNGVQNQQQARTSLGLVISQSRKTSVRNFDSKLQERLTLTDLLLQVSDDSIRESGFLLQIRYHRAVASESWKYHLMEICKRCWAKFTVFVSEQCQRRDIRRNTNAFEIRTRNHCPSILVYPCGFQRNRISRIQGYLVSIDGWAHFSKACRQQPMIFA